MGSFIAFMLVGIGCYQLCKRGPKMLRFAAEHADTCRNGASMLKRVFTR